LVVEEVGFLCVREFSEGVLRVDDVLSVEFGLPFPEVGADLIECGGYVLVLRNQVEGAQYGLQV
jgi:hypothetical protein